ncbi:MAG: DUF4838 domain-containing protein [Lentisphaeria bacterium]|nr:DUF4838 domain-containing protein [Lentisphaeria bacterium]
MIRKLFFLFAALALPLSAEVKVPRLNAAPEPDGKLDDPCWAQCEWHGGFTTLQQTAAPKAGTRFKMFHNGHTLFIGIEAAEPEMDKLKADPQIFDSRNLWMNDSVELFLCPATEKNYFYHIIADAAGQVCDAICEDNNANGYKADTVWDGAIRVKTSREADCWKMEMAVPLGAMEFKPDAVWCFNLVRNRNAVRPVEISSFSRNDGTRHTRPEIFTPLTLEDADFAAWKNIRTDLPKAKLEKQADGGFRAEITLHDHSAAKEMRILSTELSLLTPEGKTVAARQFRYAVYPNKSRQEKVVLPEVKPGAYLLDVKVYGSASSRPLLCAVRKAVSFAYAPLSIRLRTPAYRDSIYATMSDQKIRAELDFKDLKGKEWTAVLTGPDGQEAGRKSGTSAKKQEMVQFDLKGRPDGKYVLTVSAGGISVSRTVSKLPPHKGEVRVDGNGVTLVDGKPFFPFGWYGHDDADGKKAYINSILDTKLYPTFASLEKAFAARRAAGTLMLIFPFQEFQPSGSWKIFAGKNRNGGLTPAQRKYLTEFIPKIRDNPALLGYYLADEPENRDNNPRWYREAGELLRELDPYHPCIMLNWGIPGIRRFYESADILLPDCYPTFFENGKTGKPRHCTSQWAEAATALRPSWIMPQVASWPARNKLGVRGVPPTYDELRSQFFQGLIHNVKGFNMYAYFEAQRFASLMIGPDDIGRTLLVLRDLVLQNTVPGAVRVKTRPESPVFQAGLKTGKAGSILIAVNTEMKTVKAEFKVARPAFSKLYVAGEEREVVLNDGRFTDTFRPGETHVYVDSGPLADAVPSVAETRRKIDEFRASRRKPGNLIGQGEMLVSDYLDYSAGKLAPGVPEITASSDPKTFFATAKTGSRYYLIDGLTRPKRPEYAWSPSGLDKTPWIRIRLAEAAAVGEIRLYTPSGNLRSGSVEINGQKIPFANPGKEETIRIPVPALKTGEITIRFEKFVRSKSFLKVADRLLTEIEVYGAEQMNTKVILPEDPAPALKNAAKELKHYLAAAASEVTADGKPAVFELNVSSGMEEEEWRVTAEGNGRIRFSGGSPRGTLYAVYGFLENQVGIRWFSPTLEYLPRKKKLDLTGLKLSGKPFFQIRNVYRSPKAADGGRFSAHSRLNQEGEWPILSARYGSGVDFGSPSHCHSISNGYFPAGQYFKKHPEYYALVDGKRNGTLWFGQICFSRPGLAQELTAKLKEYILSDEAAARPAGRLPPRIYDISINDSRNFCQCPECAAKVAKYNASGTVLLVLNEVAAELAKFRPGYRLQTLGYFATTEPPKGGVRAADNLIVRVCNTATYLHEPITAPINEKYRRQVERWAEKAKWLFPWEYAITYGNAGRLPYPSEFTIADNIRFYAANHATGLFFEHESPEFNDFYDCKVWLEAKLMEDPSRDADALMRDFCEKVYGKAAGTVLAYRRGLRDAARRNHAQVRYFFPNPEDFRYLDWTVMKKSMELYEQALDAVKSDPSRRHQVRRAFMSLDFAMIGTLSWYYRIQAEEAGERELFASLRRQAGRRFLRCYERSLAELETLEKRIPSASMRNGVEFWRQRIAAPEFAPLPRLPGGVVAGPDCWGVSVKRPSKLCADPDAKVKALFRCQLPAGQRGKIKLALGRWNVPAQKGSELDSRTYDLKSIKGRGPVMLSAGKCRIDGEDLMLTVFNRSIAWRFGWLRDRFEGKEMEFQIEVRWDGGDEICVGIVQAAPAGK